MKNHQDIQKTIEESMENLRSGVENAKERFVENAKERFAETAEEAIDRSEEAWKDAITLIKKYPAKAVGLAVVIGAAMGVLLSGRRSKD